MMGCGGVPVCVVMASGIRCGEAGNWFCMFFRV